jgi:tetratricopeptide (TPR) repeat protein
MKKERCMDRVTLISVLASLVTIITGMAAFAQYLRSRQKKTLNSLSPDFGRHISDLILTGRTQQAIKDCEAACRKNPHDDAVYVLLSWALNEIGRHQEALDASNRAITLKESAPAYTNRGWAFQALGRYGPALEAHKKAIALDPHFAPAYKGKGDDLFANNETLDEALAAYEQAIALDPHFAPAYRGKGNVLQRQGKQQAAQQAYEQAQRLEE